MMQPRSPQSAASEAPPPSAAMMEPARRKRKRPTTTAPVVETEVAVKRPASGSETEEESQLVAARRRASRTSDSETDVAKPESTTPTASTASSSAVAPRGPFRGKCLYQSRKCENERALKRNGKPHNLCDEHRNKQNQHQRKFDAKKYTRKKRKGSGSEGDDEEDEEDPEDTPVVAVKQEDKPVASGKKRAAAHKPKRGKISPASSVAAAVAAMPPISTTSPTVADAPAYPTVYGAYYRPGLSPTQHDARPLEIRRPPALHPVHRSSPPSVGFGLPPVSHMGSPPSTFGDVLGVDRRSPQYATRDTMLHPTILVPPATPVDYARPQFPSPLGATAVYPFLRPPPATVRSRSFDSGVTRISPMGGAAPGSMGQVPFDRTHPFQDNQRGGYTPDQAHAALPMSVGRPDKLPSLQQLPLGQLTRSRSQSHHSPYAQAYQAPSHPPYAQQSPPPRHGNAFTLPRPPAPGGQLLPSLATLPQHASRHSPPSSTSPPHAQQARGTFAPRDPHHDQRPHPY